MAGFEEPNPFADPFDDPFKDSSITQATSGNSNVNSNLDEYNPFANQTNQARTNVSQPAVLQTSAVPTKPPGNVGSGQSANGPPPPYTSTPAMTLTQEELQRRQRELEEKERELAAREERLKNTVPGFRENNWPPLPKISPIGPCFYQDINVEIPVEFQKMVRHAYYLWMFYVVVLILNSLGGIAIFIEDDSSEIFISSIMALLFFTPLSFVCWFRPLYKAFRNDSSFNFMVFFFVFFCQCVLSVFWAVGIPTSASCGLITAFKSHNSTPLRIFVWLITTVLISYAVLSVLVLIQIHDLYRKNDNVSLAKAQDEFRHGALKNEFTRNAAASLAEGVTRQAMSQAFSGGGSNNPGPGLRY
ncbi:secretory carrier membrane protein [Brevipalpus obovatus]|uniref:secretory carrier membrane protein n=1 Tax=Brevipalpus obovatus TaxID=246614 RepID=UPI003D9F341C